MEKPTSKTYHKQSPPGRGRLESHYFRSDWKRTFLLDTKLKPTRKDVLNLPGMRVDFSAKWYAPVYPHESEDAKEENWKVINSFLSKLTWTEKKKFEKHFFASDISLQTTFEEFICKFITFYPVDSQKFTGLMLQVKCYLEEKPDELCEIYFMDGGKPRQRTIPKNNKLDQSRFFQGRAEDSERYPGDREIKARDKLTIQVHNLNLDVEAENKKISNVPVIAIWVPKQMKGSWYSQEPGGV
ncbi:hypothetical protein [Lyngbya aestuarii]|uniref:hypothetical protein n=1 Tax=Lyngbya aestuarii TaxID=118322 RepID=UPI00403DE4C3